MQFTVHFRLGEILHSESLSASNPSNLPRAGVSCSGMDLGAAVRSLEETKLWDSLANWDRQEVSSPNNPSPAVVATVLVASLLSLQIIQLLLPSGPSLQLSNLGGEGLRYVPPESTLRNHPKCGVTTGGQVSAGKVKSSTLYPS